MSVAAVAALPPPANSPVRKLYRHALESIFAFATLRDLHQINAVSREWSSAVLSMKPIGAAALVNDRDELLCLLGGSLRRHAGSLADSYGDHHCVGLDSPEDLPLLAEACGSSVTALNTSVHIESPEKAQASCLALERFQQLRELRVNGWTSDDGPINDTALAIGCNRAVETIGRLNPATLHTLELQLPFSADLCFAPLSALTHLRGLAISFCNPGHDPPLTEKQVEELRGLSSVHQLHLPYRLEAHAELLERLLQPGHALNWTRHDDGYCIRVFPPLAALLGSLPTLTALRVVMRCADVRFLSSLRALTWIHLNGGGILIDPDELVRSLSHCSQIETLMVERFDLNGRHLEELLPAFPLLSDCCLGYLSQVESLRCFSAPSLAASLTRLSLIGLSCCPPIEASHLLGLRSLVELENLLLSAPLGEELSAKFRAPSKHFPAL